MGDPIADRILAALRQNGEMDHTGVSALFARNVNAARLGKALEALLRAGKARMRTERPRDTEGRETAGRERTVWTAT